jgi:3-oxoacyl-[acyl-carrier-protein] synthase II
MPDWEAYTGMNTRLAAPVETPLPPFPRQKTRSMGRVAHLALAATDAALKNAGIPPDAPELGSGRVGISYGSCMGSIEPLLDFYALIHAHDMSKMNATTYVRAMPQTCAANLEVFYGLKGRFVTATAACASGSMAVGLAYELIKSGKQDVMLAGGAEEFSPANSAVFDTLFAASAKNDTPELTPAAYDKNRDGLVIGEGAGTLILEEYERAKKRGAVIYAEVAGFGTNTDGLHITNPNRGTQAQAIRLALEDAGVSPGSIGYVNTHGTATSAGDVSESWATHDVFKRPVPVSTTKNYIGHTLGACGAIEAWVTLNMMREGWFHPNINLRELDEAVAPLDYITGSGREMKVDYVMTNNFAFGGVNTSLIFKRV